MNKEKLNELLDKRPSVHRLVYGAFLQEPQYFSENVVAIPMKSLGYETQAQYLTKYSSEISKSEFNHESLEKLVKQSENSLPVISVICFPNNDDSPEKLELNTRIEFNLAIQIISWTSGNRLEEFGTLVRTVNERFVRITPPQIKKRTRLGFGNTGKDFNNQINRMIETSRNDEHFSYALSILHDANFEINPKFRIARYFNCLECLAYKLKKDNPSRKAVKKLIGLEDGAMCEISLQGKKYRYDRIEIAGRIRDKLFHGTEFKKKDLNKESKDAFELYELHPEQIATTIQGDCEIEIARWANGASRGQI